MRVEIAGAGRSEQSPPSTRAHGARRALSDVKGHLQRSALKLAGYLVLAYLVLKLVPSLKQAWHSLAHVSWQWLVGAIALEVISEVGYILAWRAIVDPDNVLGGTDGRRRMDDRVAWAQLGGGLVLPGGSWGGVGVGTWILHRFGMPVKLVAERQFNLSFLNTAVDALALVLVGSALATGVLAGEHDLLLTLLPAAVGACGIAGALILAAHAGAHAARLESKHPKIAGAIRTLGAAVEDTRRLLSRQSQWTSVLGILAYFILDVLVLFSAFFAIHAHPVPTFAVVVMAYIIGALGGSIPLPASVGTIGGIAGMLVLYGVDHSPAVAAVLLHQAIALLVPLTGGTIAYMVLRRRLGPLGTDRRGGPST